VADGRSAGGRQSADDQGQVVKVIFSNLISTFGYGLTRQIVGQLTAVGQRMTKVKCLVKVRQLSDN